MKIERTVNIMYALKMRIRRTCLSNLDEKHWLKEISFNGSRNAKSGKSERSRTKSKLTFKYVIARRDREPSRLLCKKVIKMFQKSKSRRRCIERYNIYTPHTSPMGNYLPIEAECTLLLGCVKVLWPC